MPFNLTRSIVVFLVPGGIAIFPYVLLLISIDERVRKFYVDYPPLVSGATVAAVIIAGTLIHRIDLALENWWDRRIEKQGKYRVSSDWFDYISRICSSDPVAHGYIKKLVIGFEFQMAMGTASAVSSLGWAFWTQRHILLPQCKVFHWFILNWVLDDWEWGRFFQPMYLAVIVALVFYRGAAGTCDELYETRQQLNFRLRLSDMKESSSEWDDLCAIASKRAHRSRDVSKWWSPRWWGRLIYIWPVSTVAFLLITATFYKYRSSSNELREGSERIRLEGIDEYWDVSLGFSQAQARYVRGRPSEPVVDGENTEWKYTKGGPGRHSISWDEKANIRYIGCTGEVNDCEGVAGVTIGTTEKAALRKLGKPLKSWLAESGACFLEYGQPEKFLIITLEQKKVVALQVSRSMFMCSNETCSEVVTCSPTFLSTDSS